MAMAVKGKRVRRAPEEARKLILDAAESTMGADGPAGLRLQDVAQAAGVSHPTILHHFGSRDGLVRALYLRTLEELKSAVIAHMGEAKGESIKLTFAAYRNGLAQRIMWLMQSAETPARLQIFEDIVQSVHAARLKASGRKADIKDTRAVVHLITIAAFGDALIGGRFHKSDGGDERAARDRFENWFCDLIALHMHSA